MARSGKNLGPDERAALSAALGEMQQELRAMIELLRRRLAEADEREARRRARLRRLSLGLLGR